MMKYDYARVLMNRCQRMVLYACLNVCRTVSTDCMQVLMGVPPWDLECERRGVMCMLKNGWSVNDNNLVSVEDLNGKSVEECVSLLNERVYERWQARWDECVNGRVTYEYIKNVRYAERNTCFEPNVYVCFMLTGHGCMNGFLYKRGLCESARCVCGAECEDWVHVLSDCRLYDDLRDLSVIGVRVNDDGRVDVSAVLECKATYECFCKFVVSAFKRRRMVVRGV